MNVIASEALSAQVASILRVLSDHLSSEDVVHQGGTGITGVVEYQTPRFSWCADVAERLAGLDSLRVGLHDLLEATTITTGKVCATITFALATLPPSSPQLLHMYPQGKLS